MPAHKQGKKNRKHGRNEAFCAIYAREGRREKNKAAKLMRVLRRSPWNDSARKAYEALPLLAKRGNGELPPRSLSPKQLREAQRQAAA